jgi:mono/diheme cytochrome c family protein
VSGLRTPLVAGLVAAALAFAAVALATDEGDSGDHAPPADAARPAPPSAGRAVFARMGCGSCHHLTAAGSSGPIGPDLDTRLPDHTRASLTAKILAPGRASVMPSDFGARLTDADLDALVDFLLATAPSR